MVKSENKKIDNIEKLVETVAVAVFELTDKVDNIQKDVIDLKKDMGEVKENIKITRQDVLNMGDRFVSDHIFDQLASRVNVLEKKVTSKK